MSYVTDVLLICDLQETFTEDFEMLENPEAIARLNTWLEAGEWSPLVRMDIHIGMNSDKAFQACAYGAALNFLEVQAFLDAISRQPWKKPESLMLLLKTEEDTEFTVYRLRDGALVS